MSWNDIKKRQPIDGQQAIIYTKDHQMFMLFYDKDNKEFYDQGHFTIIFEVDILFWSQLPEKPEENI